jgi:predicted site-specific integrase-resolvase
MIDPDDKVIWRRDLMKMLGGVASETVRRWLKEGKLPAPDVDLSQRTRGWRKSTLRAAGINVP